MKTKLLKKLRRKANDRFMILEEFNDGWSYQTYHVLREIRDPLGWFSTVLAMGTEEALEKARVDAQKKWMKEEVERLHRKRYEGKLFLHFKGTTYKVLHVGYDTESGQRLIIYRDAYDSGKKIWVRPEKMWNEEVEKDGVRVKRFRELNQ